MEHRTMTNTTAPPTMLRFTDPGLREQLEALPASAALIGIGPDGTAIAVNLDDTPHVLVCTGTGGGSTTILRTLIAQFLHQGAHALVLDGARVAHRWRRVPDSDAPRQRRRHPEALVGLAAELQRRTDLDGEPDGVPRLMVVLDRAAAVRHLARYWETFRQKDDSNKSPAITALEDVLYEGRQARIHVLYNGRAAAKAPSPPPASHLILARVGAGTWQRLASIAGPVLKAARSRAVPRHPGGHRSPDADASPDRRRSRRLACHHQRQCLVVLPPRHDGRRRKLVLLLDDPRRAAPADRGVAPRPGDHDVGMLFRHLALPPAHRQMLVSTILPVSRSMRPWKSPALRVTVIRSGRPSCGKAV